MYIANRFNSQFLRPFTQILRKMISATVKLNFRLKTRSSNVGLKINQSPNNTYKWP